MGKELREINSLRNVEARQNFFRDTAVIARYTEVLQECLRLQSSFPDHISIGFKDNSGQNLSVAFVEKLFADPSFSRGDPSVTLQRRHLDASAGRLSQFDKRFCWQHYRASVQVWEDLPDDVSIQLEIAFQEDPFQKGLHIYFQKSVMVYDFETGKVRDIQTRMVRNIRCFAFSAAAAAANAKATDTPLRGFAMSAISTARTLAVSKKRKREEGGGGGGGGGVDLSTGAHTLFLPPEWEVRWSKSQKRAYFWHEARKKSLWFREFYAQISEPEGRKRRKTDKQGAAGGGAGGAAAAGGGLSAEADAKLVATASQAGVGRATAPAVLAALGSSESKGDGSGSGEGGGGGEAAGAGAAGGSLPEGDATLEHMRALVIPRAFFEEWIDRPYLAEAAVGGFVRFSQESEYMLCEILDVTRYKREYRIVSGGPSTTHGVLLRHGILQRVMPMSRTSNSAVTHNEFCAWALACKRADLPPLSAAEAVMRRRRMVSAVRRYESNPFGKLRVVGGVRWGGRTVRHSASVVYRRLRGGQYQALMQHRAASIWKDVAEQGAGELGTPGGLATTQDKYPEVTAWRESREECGALSVTLEAFTAAIVQRIVEGTHVLFIVDTDKLVAAGQLAADWQESSLAAAPATTTSAAPAAAAPPAAGDVAAPAAAPPASSTEAATASASGGDSVAQPTVKTESADSGAAGAAAVAATAAEEKGAQSEGRSSRGEQRGGKKKRKKGSGEVCTDTFPSGHVWMSEGVIDELLRGTAHAFHGIKVWSVVLESFRRNRPALGHGQGCVLYHGTSWAAANGIVASGGFRVGPKCHKGVECRDGVCRCAMMSRGVYLADIEKAESNVSRVARWDEASQLMRGTLLRVRADLGCCKVAQRALCDCGCGQHYVDHSGRWRDQGFDAIYVRGGTAAKRSEWCVKSPSQAIVIARRDYSWGADKQLKSEGEWVPLVPETTKEEAPPSPK